MLTKIEKTTINWILSATTLIATIVVMPWFAYDPINTPKLAVVTLGGFAGFSLLLGKNFPDLFHKYRSLLALSILFITDAVVVIFASGADIPLQLFGTFGRSTGLIAYLALTYLLISAAVVASKDTFRLLSFSLLVAGLVSTVYGLFQSFNLDFYNWVNDNSTVIGFLGNPNFQSTFLGFCAVLTLSLLLSIYRNVRFAAILTLSIVTVLFTIYRTGSQQGLIVFAFGASIVFLIRVSKSSFVRTMPILLSAFIGSGVFIVLGMLNKGPAAALVYKPSVTYRGDYWRAGWKMTLDHPFFGVGLDSYGDWYRRARTVEATIRRGPQIVSNAAHNVFLDFSSNGGFPLLIIYSCLLILVLRSIFKIWKREESFNPYVFGLIAVWFCYLAQTLISINQLGLAVWGWVISGLIIGYEVNYRKGESEEKNLNGVQTGHKPKNAPTHIPARAITTLTLFSIIGISIGSIPFIASNKYSSGLKTRDAQRVEASAYTWPYEPERFAQVGLVLANNKLQPAALKVLSDGVSRFPDNFALWNLISQLPNADKALSRQAKAELKRLDPHNPDLK